jgi:predicted nuclease with RNAse H fold
MKKIITSALLLLSISIYSQNRYELIDEGKDKEFLSDTISKMSTKGLVTDKPIVVVDGKPFRYQDLETKKLELSKNEIAKIIPIDKQKGINIFGEFGEAGVVIVTTNRPKK